MDNPNIAVAEKFTAAVMSGDEAGVRSLIDPDFVVHQAEGLEYAGQYKGADGFMEFMKRFDAAYEMEGLETGKTFVTDDPDVLILEFGPSGKLRSSGKKFKGSVLEVWRFRNGKLIHIAPHWFEKPR
jgi:ketosteroid isomerase-like protein